MKDPEVKKPQAVKPGARTANSLRSRAGKADAAKA